MMFDMRQMSASTPPSMGEENRVDLLDESQIPLPSSATSSEIGQDDIPFAEDSFTSEGLQGESILEANVSNNPQSDRFGRPENAEEQTDPVLETSGVAAEESDPAFLKDDPPIPLSDLLNVMNEDKYQSRRLVTLQDEAYGLFHKCGSCDRFLTVQRHLYRRMTDCFRSDKKNAFASLYTKAMSYPSFEDLEAPTFGFEDTLGTTRPDALEPSSDSSWIQRLPPESRKSLMEFLASVRNDSSFVAERICRLSEPQLKRLARPHRLQAAADSVIQSNRGYGRYDSRGFQRPMAKPGDQTPSVDDLMSDPLMLLINGVFDSSSGPGSPERLRQVNVWSSVCCKLIENTKPGSDEFCITVLNAFGEMSEWPLGPRLELFLAELIASGEPLFEGMGGHNHGFTQTLNPGQGDHGQLVSRFFEWALNCLLDLMVDDPNQSVPSRALEMIRSVLDRIGNQERKLTARNFFFLRWFCESFLYNAIVFPEAHGIMMDHSLSSNLRDHILRELVVRLQKLVTDVLSPWSSTPVNPTLEAKIRKLLESFEVVPPTTSERNEGETYSQNKHFLFLRPEDVLAISRSLSSEAYLDSSSNSVFEHPSSRASSIFGLPSFSSGPVPSNVGESPYLRAPGNMMMQSNTWHTPSVGGRPSIANSTYFFDRNQAIRPDSSGGVLDLEKENIPSFTHDLWLITANREFQGPGPRKRHEAMVLFISPLNGDLSLSPFRTASQPIGNQGEERSFGTLPGMPYGDSVLLATALSRIAGDFRGPGGDFNESSDNLERLTSTFEQNLRQSRSMFDFQAEYFWWNCLRTLHTLDSKIVQKFLVQVFQRRQLLVEVKQNLSDQYEEWLYTLRQRSKAQDQTTQRVSLSSKNLRNKMWYTSDVRNSAAYEDAYNITRALKAMLEPVEQRSSGMTAWARQRIRNSFGHERVLSQTLELMTAPKTYGGPNKLSESQVQITTDWLLADSIENFCRGEERIHRFCYEIQKCVKRLAGEAVLDSPVLWSSPLYQIEKAEHGIAGNAGHRHSQEAPPWNTDFSYLHTWNMPPNLAGQSPPLSFQTADSPSSTRSGASNIHAISDPSHNLGTSPQMQGRSFVPRNWALPPSPISPGNVKTSSEGSSLRRRAFLQNLRTHLTSLLLSDLGSLLWSRGSDTDSWINGLGSPAQLDAPSNRSSLSVSKPFGGRVSLSSDPQIASTDEGSTILGSLGRPPNSATPITDLSLKPFDFSDTFKMLLKRFQLTPNPQSKLQHLYELFMMAAYSCQAKQYQDSLDDSHPDIGEKATQGGITDSVMGFGAPRTRLTRLQEVAANCEDRRKSSLANQQSQAYSRNSHSTALPAPQLNDPALTALIQSIFADAEMRPPTLFRDLQFIASLTPSSTLDYTPQGTAFWTVGLAAMSIKTAKSRSMTDRAMQILEFHYGNSNQNEPARLRRGSQELAAMSASSLSQQDLLGTTLQDAARLLTVSALEGDPAAARELALFHLTHPELVSRITLPLSRPSDVFRAKHGGASDRGHRSGGEDSGGLDPITFAVVFHWMEFAANAGDTDAITFFKENEGLGQAL